MSSDRQVHKIDDVIVVVDLVSDSDGIEENDDDTNDDTGKKPAGGKRKLELELLEPNRKNPLFPRKDDGDAWNEASDARRVSDGDAWNEAADARRVSPELDFDQLHEEEEVINVEITATASPVAKETYEAAAKPPPHIWLNDDDGIITYGVVFPSLQKLEEQSNQPTKSFLLTNSEFVQHIQQTDRWSCGFRNTQMLLSALVPLLQASHPFFQAMEQMYAQVPLDLVESISTDLLVLPSLTQLQKEMETSWSQGFDPEGAKHFKHSVVGRPSKIGAVEVWFLFAFWRVDAHIVQFTKCIESRRLLPVFVFKYFQTPPQPDESAACVVQKCVAWAEENWDSPKTATELLGDADYANKDNPTILPLYLQWEGHSVTIVGIEPPQGNAATHRTNDWNQWNLLILCPLKCGVKIKNGGISPFRISCRTLGRIHCQVLAAGWNALTPEERKSRQTKAVLSTAAEKDVIMALRRDSWIG
jgi:Peptidase family C78